MVTTESFKVYDSRDFYYEVTIAHVPICGFSTAYYKGSPIAQVELGRILPPIGDNDREWEEWEERFAEWCDEVKVNMAIKCKEYFDNQYR